MNFYLFILTAFSFIVETESHTERGFWDPHEQQYGYFDERIRHEMLRETRQMFYFAYDNYMKYAFPKDELDPIHCNGRGPDYDNPSNININDVLGDYSLTLVDVLDTLVVMGNISEFERAVQLVLENVSFDKPATVQVFEATIRVLGALLSAHLIIKDPLQPFGQLSSMDYDDGLLELARDLGSRLIVAFENTATGIPHPRVNLQAGVPLNSVNETCTAGAGTLLLEFGILSRLSGDPTFEGVARRAVNQLWAHRSNVTGLFGNVINIQTGKWIGFMSGLGAGLDSFYEYLLKSFILFGDEDYLMKFKESYDAIQFYMRRGRKQCNEGSGIPPIYVNVNMWNGELINNWMDSLQAAWPGVQVLAGDLEEAICLHAVYYAIWQRFDALPERFNWNLRTPEVLFYPLRPEFVESTYHLYQATKNPFYLHVGKHIVYSLNNYTKVQCGYATVHDVTKKDNEDRMESFFLSETCKYLYLLFDIDNYVNKQAVHYIFSTEGHLFPVNALLRRSLDDFTAVSSRHSRTNFTDTAAHDSSTDFTQSAHSSSSSESVKHVRRKCRNNLATRMDSVMPEDSFLLSFNTRQTNVTAKCDRVPAERRFYLPLQSHYFQQLRNFVGIE